MKKDIDNILSDYFTEAPLSAEERQVFEEWRHSSRHNERVGEIIESLKKQKKVLDGHLTDRDAFEKTRQAVSQSRMKRRMMFLLSSAAGICLLVGAAILLRLENTTTGPISVDQTPMAGFVFERPAAELILPDGTKRMLSQDQTCVVVSDGDREMRTDNQTLIVESNDTQTKEPEYYTLHVPYGAEYSLVLSDGTKIYLNAGSKLRYPNHFNGDTREVFLSGEGYFEVKSDSLHPFVVHTPDVRIRVMGTSFNVNAYPDEGWVKTTLVEGEVETDCGDKRISMTPGTQVAYDKSTRQADYFPVNVRQFISWKDGYYDFEEMPLEELMQIFVRWYNIRIEFADTKARGIKFSGRLKRYEDIRSLFKMLEYTRNVDFIFTEDKIMIQSK